MPWEAQWTNGKWAGLSSQEGGDWIFPRNFGECGHCISDQNSICDFRCSKKTWAKNWHLGAEKKFWNAVAHWASTFKFSFHWATTLKYYLPHKCVVCQLKSLLRLISLSYQTTNLPFSLAQEQNFLALGNQTWVFTCGVPYHRHWLWHGVATPSCVDQYSIKSKAYHLKVERGTVRVKCLTPRAQHNHGLNLHLSIWGHWTV